MLRDAFSSLELTTTSIPNIPSITRTSPSSSSSFPFFSLSVLSVKYVLFILGRFTTFLVLYTKQRYLNARHSITLLVADRSAAPRAHHAPYTIYEYMIHGAAAARRGVQRQTRCTRFIVTIASLRLLYHYHYQYHRRIT